MTTTVTELYSLPRDQVESKRLNSQHEVLKSSAGFSIHPRIVAALDLHGEMNIADVATGTGVWMMDAASDFPEHWQWTGFDMSSDQFPDVAEINPRIAFEVLNILEPIPERWRGQFDLVHLRQLLLGLTSSDWTIAAHNVFNLLKPGGWIQWQEQNGSSNTLFPTGGPASSVNTQRVLDHVIAVQRKASTCLPEDAPKFKKRVEDGGFIECEVHRASSDRDPTLRQAATMSIHTGLISMMKTIVMRDPNSSWTLKDIDELEEKALAEIADGKLYWHFETNTITGQKPM